MAGARTRTNYVALRPLIGKYIATNLQTTTLQTMTSAQLNDFFDHVFPSRPYTSDDEEIKLKTSFIAHLKRSWGKELLADTVGSAGVKALVEGSIGARGLQHRKGELQQKLVGNELCQPGNAKVEGTDKGGKEAIDCQSLLDEFFNDLMAKTPHMKEHEDAMSVNVETTHVTAGIEQGEATTGAADKEAFFAFDAAAADPNALEITRNLSGITISPGGDGIATTSSSPSKEEVSQLRTQLDDVAAAFEVGRTAAAITLLAAAIAKMATPDCVPGPAVTDIGVKQEVEEEEEL